MKLTTKFNGTTCIVAHAEGRVKASFNITSFTLAFSSQFQAEIPVIRVWFPGPIVHACDDHGFVGFYADDYGKCSN